MQKSRFHNMTITFLISSLVLILFCVLCRNGTYPKINSILWVSTLTSLTFFIFYLMNEVIYIIKRKKGIPCTKEMEIFKPIKKVKKKRKKTSYKKVFKDVEQYSIIPSIVLMEISLTLMFLTFEPGVKNEKTAMFYFLNTPIFVVSCFTFLITLSSNYRLKWLKAASIVAAFVLSMLLLIFISIYHS